MHIDLMFIVAAVAIIFAPLGLILGYKAPTKIEDDQGTIVLAGGIALVGIGVFVLVGSGFTANAQVLAGLSFDCGTLLLMSAFGLLIGGKVLPTKEVSATEEENE